jgi:hypothetical protein
MCVFEQFVFGQPRDNFLCVLSGTCRFRSPRITAQYHLFREQRLEEIRTRAFAAISGP